MKRLLVLLMIIAAPASAATFTADFTKTRSLAIWPCDNINSLTSGGITATFGGAFSYSWSYEMNPPYVEPECSNYGVWANDMTPGIYRNAPSGEWVAGFNQADCTGGSSTADRLIYFSTAIRSFSCQLSGVKQANVWTCYPWIFSCDGGAHWNTHCQSPLGGTLWPGFTIEMWGDNFGAAIKATVHPQEVDGWANCEPEYPDQPGNAGGPYAGAQFTWHTKTPMCNWQYVSVVSPVPI